MRVNSISKLMCAVLSALAVSSANAADKISDGVVKIGIMTDMAGPYSDITGAGSVVAAKMAIDDFGGKVLGKPIELVSGDHQNKADVGSAMARRWFDTEKVDMIGDLVTSSVGLAVQAIGNEKNRITMNSGSATSALTGKACTATGVHWVYDTYAMAHVVGDALVGEGNKSWFFITADYAFGYALEGDVSKVVKDRGGEVLGSVRHPLNSGDFSSYLLKAQSTGAQVVGMANAGTDLMTAIKQSREYGIAPKQKVASLLMTITDINSLGLDMTQNLYLSEAFYWDLNPETREWSKRFFEKHKRMPTMVHAGVYSSISHYLKAVKAAGTDDTATVLAKMREMPINDMFAKNGKLRTDGRMVHDMYLFQVKKPSESKGPWDFYKLIRTVSGDKAFMPLDKSECPLVKS